MRGAEPKCVETQTDNWLTACELPEPHPESPMRMSSTRQWESAVKAEEVQKSVRSHESGVNKLLRQADHFQDHH